MIIEQTNCGETEIKILFNANGDPYIKMDDLITTLKAWANANKDQIALMGLAREFIKVRNKHKKRK